MLKNRAARVLTYSNYDVDAVQNSIACQHKIQGATMVYRSQHRLAPDNLSSKFERRETAYNLIDSENKLNVTAFVESSFLCNNFSFYSVLGIRY